MCNGCLTSRISVTRSAASINALGRVTTGDDQVQHRRLMGRDPCEHLGGLQPAEVQQIGKLVQQEHIERATGDALLRQLPAVQRFGLRGVQVATRPGKAIAHRGQLHLHPGQRAQLTEGGVRMLEELHAADTHITAPGPEHYA